MSVVFGGAGQAKSPCEVVRLARESGVSMTRVAVNQAISWEFGDQVVGLGDD